MDENLRITDLRKKLEKDPGSRLFAQLAEELRKEGKFDEAITVAREGLEKIPNYPSARLTLARALLDAGRPAEARPELEQIVRVSPDNILAGRLLGEALEDLGELIASIKQFEKTLVFAPGDKAIVEKLATLRYKPARPATQPPQRPAPPPQAPKPLPPAFAAPASDGLDPTVKLERSSAPLPSVPEPSVPSVFDAPVAAPSILQAPPAPAAPAPPPVPVASTVALDRDLASGTFSPGSLNVADLQKHFEAVAEEDSTLPAPVEVISTSGDLPEIEDTVGFGELQAAPEDDPKAVVEASTLPLFATAKTQLFSLPADEAASLSPEFPSEEEPADAVDIGAQTLPLTSVTLADLYLQQGLKAEASEVLSRVMRDEPQNDEARARFAEVAQEKTPVPEPRPSAPVVAPLPPPPAIPPRPEVKPAPPAVVTPPPPTPLPAPPPVVVAAKAPAPTPPPKPAAAAPAPPLPRPAAPAPAMAPVRSQAPVPAKAPAPAPAPVPPVVAKPVAPVPREAPRGADSGRASYAKPISELPRRSRIRERTIASLRAFQNAAEREAVQQRASELSPR